MELWPVKVISSNLISSTKPDYNPHICSLIPNKTPNKRISMKADKRVSPHLNKGDPFSGRKMSQGCILVILGHLNHLTIYTHTLLECSDASSSYYICWKLANSIYIFSCRSGPGWPTSLKWLQFMCNMIYIPSSAQNFMKLIDLFYERWCNICFDIFYI